MSTRRVKYKANKYIEPCPKCSNNTGFLIHSEQAGEDYCEIWTECKCGFIPGDWRDRIEDVWGGCSDENCQWAINETRNALLPIDKDAQECDARNDDSNSTAD